MSSKEDLLLRVLEHGEQCRYGPEDPERWEAVLREDLKALKGIEP